MYIYNNFLYKYSITEKNRIMPFEKGKEKTGGRAKGVTNKKTKAFEVLKDSILGEHTERFNDEMSQLNGRDFINAYLNVLEFFAPKLSRQEMKAHVENINIPPKKWVEDKDE